MTYFHLCRNVETLAQRVAKRARASMSGQPPAGTSSTPLVMESSPDSSPRRSPQHAFVTRSLSTCVGVRSLGADLVVVVVGGRKQDEPLRATPNTSPRGASQARAPSTEPMRTMEEEEANPGADGSIPAPNVGGEEATPSQSGTGELFALCPYSFFFF